MDVESRLKLACVGKSYSAGGLNVPDLIALAVEKGVPEKTAHVMSRAELLKIVCAPAAATHAPVPMGAARTGVKLAAQVAERASAPTPTSTSTSTSVPVPAPAIRVAPPVCFR